MKNTSWKSGSHLPLSPARFLCIAAASLLAASLPAHADDLRINNLANSQASFRALTETLGAATSYKGIIPAESQGITGFDVGVGVTTTRINDKAAWARATGASSPDYFTQTKLQVHKGLPFGVDVGFVASNSNTNVSTVGGELRYALIKGNVAVPAVGLRAAYTKVNGVDRLDLGNKSVELTISKGLLMFTPYAGVGHVWTTATPNGVAGLTKEDVGLFRAYAGANLNFGLMNMAIEADKTGPTSSLSAKIGLRF